MAIKSDDEKGRGRVLFQTFKSKIKGIENQYFSFF